MLRHPLAALEQADAVVDVVRQEAGAAALALVRRGVAGRPFQGGAHHRVEHQVRVGVGRHAAHLEAGGLLVARGDAHHRAAVVGGRLDLVGRLEVRVEPAVRVHRRVEHQAEVVGVVQDAIDGVPARLGEVLLALGVPEEVLAALVERHVGVHAVAVHAGDRLGQERGGAVQVRGHLAAQQLVELHLVGGDQRVGVAEVHLELAGRHLGVVLLVAGSPSRAALRRRRR